MTIYVDMSSNYVNVTWLNIIFMIFLLNGLHFFGYTLKNKGSLLELMVHIHGIFPFHKRFLIGDKGSSDVLQ